MQTDSEYNLRAQTKKANTFASIDRDFTVDRHFTTLREDLAGKRRVVAAHVRATFSNCYIFGKKI